MIDLAGLRRSKEMSAAMLTQSHLDAFATALRARLQSGEGGFPKRYLRQFASDIRFDGKRLTMTGRKDALLMAAMNKKMGTAGVPTSGLSWLPKTDDPTQTDRLLCSAVKTSRRSKLPAAAVTLIGGRLRRQSSPQQEVA
jgi:hypothetical protein